MIQFLLLPMLMACGTNSPLCNVKTADGKNVDYKIGMSWAADDGCNECKCSKKGEITCTEKACGDKGKGKSKGKGGAKAKGGKAKGKDSKGGKAKGKGKKAD